MGEVDDSAYKIINRIQKNSLIKSHTRYDLLTFCSAKEYISKKHPSVVFLGLEKRMNPHTPADMIFIYNMQLLLTA